MKTKPADSQTNTLNVVIEFAGRCDISTDYALVKIKIKRNVRRIVKIINQ